MGAKGTKLAYLESLRGIAAFSVVLNHFAGSFFPATMGGAAFAVHSRLDLLFYSTPLKVIINGNFAVCMFFVLSGYVLTRAFFLTKNPGLLTKAAFKRYARLMPPVAVSVAGAFLLMRAGWFYNQQAAAITGSSGLGELWQFFPRFSTALTQAFFSNFISSPLGTQSYNPVLWTMQIEFLGSMLVFAVAGLFGTYRRRALVYVVLAVLTVKTYYLGFVLGMAVADLSAFEAWRSWMASREWWLWASVLALGLMLGGYPSAGYTDGTVYHRLPSLWGQAAMLYPTWHTLGALLVVLAVMGWAGLQRVLSVRPLVELGRQSFGLYLTHLIIIGTFSSYLFTSLKVSHGYGSSFAVTFAVSLPLMFAISWVYANWVDAPAIRFARWVATERRRRAVQPTAPEPVPAPAIAPGITVEG